MNSERHFHIIQLNNKNVKIGNVSIKKESTPINAAKKLLNNLVKNKLNLKKANILIKESTKGSTKKIYGPYLGYFQKNKLVEIKKDVKVKTKTSAPNSLTEAVTRRSSTLVSHTDEKPQADPRLDRMKRLAGLN